MKADEAGAKINAAISRAGEKDARIRTQLAEGLWKEVLEQPGTENRFGLNLNFGKGENAAMIYDAEKAQSTQNLMSHIISTGTSASAPMGALDEMTKELARISPEEMRNMSERLEHYTGKTGQELADMTPDERAKYIKDNAELAWYDKLSSLGMGEDPEGFAQRTAALFEMQKQMRSVFSQNTLLVQISTT